MHTWPMGYLASTCAAGPVSRGHRWPLAGPPAPPATISPTHAQFMFTHLQPVHVYTHTTCSCLHTYNLFMFTHLQPCSCLHTYKPVHVYTLTTCLCLHTYNLFMFTHLQPVHVYTLTNLFMFTHLQPVYVYTLTNLVFIHIHQLISRISTTELHKKMLWNV